ncbi:protein quiver-like [Phlebotomus papatasi]|uniref:protein quiver-like n=1 Tax=Phlebotomus papatasi TaxID=29031 RepID=UPI002483D1B6|nr:protein quiver-like [Phlebotomus papatasi]
MAKILLVTVLLIFCVAQVTSTICYNCDSQTSESCRDPPNTNIIPYFECGPNTKCGKVIAHGNGRSVLLRACAYNYETCSEIAQIPGITIEHCSFCYTDLCNSSVKLSGGFFAILPVIVSIFVLNRS